MNFRQAILSILNPEKKPALDEIEKRVTIPKNTMVIQATHRVYKLKEGYFKMLNENENYMDFNRKLAYEALARLFHIESMIPHSELCIGDADTECIGLLQEPSAGINKIMEFTTEERIEMMTPAFQRDMAILRLFDVCCYEIDHSFNNCFPVIKEGRFVGMSAFDNGGVGSFSLHSHIGFCSYYGCCPLIENEVTFTFPYVDYDMATHICRCRLADIYRALHSYIGIVPILFTWKRIRKVKRCLRQGVIWLKQDEWTDKMIEEEVTGRYGETYLYAFAHRWGGDMDLETRKLLDM